MNSMVKNIKYTTGLIDGYLQNRQSQYGSLNLDDNTVGFFQRQLEQNLGKIFESMKPEITIAQDIITKSGLPYEIKEVYYTEVDTTGKATIIGGGTDDINQVTTVGQEVKYKRAKLAIGYAYSQEELDVMFSQVQFGRALNINEYKIKGCVEALDDLSEKLGYYGNTEHGIVGLLTDPAVPVVNDTFKPFLTTRTAEQLYTWFYDSYSLVKNRTRLRLNPNNCLMSTKLLDKLISTRSTSANNRTAWEMILDLFSRQGTQLPNVILQDREALRQSELERYGVTAPGDNEEILVFYNKSEDTTFRMINDIRTQPFQRNNMNFSTIMYYDVTSTIMPYKEAISIIKYPIATT
jgi:hypothetical protein